MENAVFSPELYRLIQAGLLVLIVIILVYIAAKVRDIGSNLPGGNINGSGGT